MFVDKPQRLQTREQLSQEAAHMTHVLCQTGAYGSVPAFPPSHQCRMTDSNLVPCLKRVTGPQPVPSSIKKAISTVGSGHRNVLLWRAESRPTQGPRLWGKLALSSAVLYRHREGLGPGVFEDRSSLFFPMGFWRKPSKRRHPSPFSYPHLQLLRPLPCHSSCSVILER